MQDYNFFTIHRTLNGRASRVTITFPPGSGVPGPEAGEPAAGPGGSPQDHGLWIRQADH